MSSASAPDAMLIDGFMPRWDVRERHRLRVDAPPAVTYAALATTDFARSRIVDALMAVRMLPARLLGGGDDDGAQRGSGAVTLATLERAGFRTLADAPPTELVLGLEGRFWRPRGDVCTPPAAGFAAGTVPAPGTARAVWNVSVAPLPDGASLLATETRVLCADAAARRRFLPYWLLVRPGSGIIRRVMLRAIRAAAERRAASGG